MRAIAISEKKAAHIRATIQAMEEKQRKQYAAREALLIGYGGISAIHRITGISIPTIKDGIKQIERGDLYERNGRNRKPGGGRKKASERFKKTAEEKNLKEGTNLTTDLNKAVESILTECTYGDPCKTNRYTNITPGKVTEEINKTYDSDLSESTFRRVFFNLNYSLQQNAKLEQVGKPHPMRDPQFQYRDEILDKFMDQGIPILSCDTKAKLKLGNFTANGREWRPVGNPRAGEDHDFGKLFRDLYPNGHPDLDDYFLDKPAIVNPYAVYCYNFNNGYVNLGISSDTSEFAANSIYRWWENSGQILFPHAEEMLVLVDGGGSNRSRGFLWKEWLAKSCIRMGMKGVQVFHHPPGASKWNIVEHMMLNQISINWKSKAKTNLEVVRGYICNTTTKTGLKILCDIDYGIYLTETKRMQMYRESNQSLSSMQTAEERFNEIAHLEFFHDDPIMKQWNYKIVID